MQRYVHVQVASERNWLSSTITGMTRSMKPYCANYIVQAENNQGNLTVTTLWAGMVT